MDDTAALLKQKIRLHEEIERLSCEGELKDAVIEAARDIDRHFLSQDAATASIKVEYLAKLKLALAALVSTESNHD